MRRKLMICNHLIKEGYEDIFQVDAHPSLAVVQLALAVLMQRLPVGTQTFFFLSCGGDNILTFCATLA